MFRSLTTAVLCFMLARAPLAQADDAAAMRERVRQMAVGSLVEVNVTGKKKLSGRLGAVGADSFELRPTNGSGNRTLRYEEVADIQRVEHKGTRTWVKVVIGVGIGVVAWVIIGATGVLSR
ncbi:MAG: hypothetical protein U0Q16_37940 [Bryobacteraceae bacterium]